MGFKLIQILLVKVLILFKSYYFKLHTLFEHYNLIIIFEYLNKNWLTLYTKNLLIQVLHTALLNYN